MLICIPPPYTVWRNSPMRYCVSPFGVMANVWSWVIYKERHFSWVWARESKAKVPGCGTWWWSFLCSCQKSEGAEETASIRPFCNSSNHSLGQNPGVLNTSPSAPLPTVLQWGLSFRHPSWEDTFRTQQILTQDSRETKPKGTHFYPQMAKLWHKVWSWRISSSCHICFLPSSNHL